MNTPSDKYSSWDHWSQHTSYTVDTNQQRRHLKVFDTNGILGTLRMDTTFANEKFDSVVSRQTQIRSFATNDYLGFGNNRDVCTAAHTAIDRFGTSTGSSRLVAGNRSIHEELQKSLATYDHTDNALVLSSGYLANIAALTTFGTAGVRILSDAWNHASIIDGCRLAAAETIIYPHVDMVSLEQELIATRNAHLLPLVVSDTVFSMDGDIAPLLAIAELCSKYEALLVVDNAHDVFQEHTCISNFALSHNLNYLFVGTLSKIFGSLGGYIAGTDEYIEILISKARTFLFDTGLSPADTAAALAAVNILLSPAGDKRKENLRALLHSFSPEYQTPIVPLIIGSESETLQLAEKLLQHGFFVPAIRPPTVPKGTSRLRISFSTHHSIQDVQQLKNVLKQHAIPLYSKTFSSPSHQLKTPTQAIDSAPNTTQNKNNICTLAILGTNTDIGKTWVSTQLIKLATENSFTISAYKPVQSCEPTDIKNAYTDAHVISEALSDQGIDTCPDAVCPPSRWYSLPLAPPIAAQRLGKDPIYLDQLVRETKKTQHTFSQSSGHSKQTIKLFIVETVGGVCSPCAEDGTSGDLARALTPFVYILVADAGLGTIHSVHASLCALNPEIFKDHDKKNTHDGERQQQYFVLLNHFDAQIVTHQENLAWLQRDSNIHVFTSVQSLFETITKIYN